MVPLLLLLWVGRSSQQAECSSPECSSSRVVAGSSPTSGEYLLKATGDARCSDGCLYEKEGVSSSICFESSVSSGYTVSDISCSAATSTTATPTTTVTLPPNISASEVWEIDRTRFSPPTITQKGDWGVDEFCDVGAYAIAFQLYVAGLCDRRCLTDDDQALMGVRLTCADYDEHTGGGGATTTVEVSSTVAGPCDRRRGLTCDWKAQHACPSGTFLTESRYLSEYFHDTSETNAGAEFIDECPVGVVCRNITTSSSDPVGGMNVDMRCSDGSVLTGDGVMQGELPLVDGEQTSSWSSWTSCPPHYAICGIRSRVHQGETDDKSNLGQSEVLFHCCQLPPSFSGRI